jgi:uncharacterized protein
MTMIPTQMAQNQPPNRGPNPSLNMSRLRDIFVRHAGIQAVYLFGSTVSGHTHGKSDLDFAIVPHADTRLDKLALLADLAQAGYCDVDLVLLDTDDVVLKFEAVRQNCLIYAAPDFEHGVYYSRTIRQYLDFVPYLTTQRKAYRERILHGES